MVAYKLVVKEILNLNWSFLDEENLQRLMVLSAYAALEFADSLRLTLKLYPQNESLKEMVAEELDTNNMSFGDYNERGDHSQFLWHFIHKYGLEQKFEDVRKAGEEYVEKIKKLSPEIRVMSIVSREHELPGIFTKILTARKWKAKGLSEFRYYLERHIFLDSHEGGHADMLRNFKVDDNVAQFYKIRLEMYKCIPELFEKKKA